MLNVFFKDIPSIVFEPVAIFGWAGLLTALYLCRKERTTFYWTVIFSLAFMILWRCAIQIVSSRYAEILIFPMTAAAAYFIFQLENIRKFFPKLPEKYAKFLPYAVLIILALICVGKDLSYNRYHPFMEASGIVKADNLSGKRVIYTLEKSRDRQITYYSGCEVRSMEYAGDQISDACRAILDEARSQSYQTVYIFIPSAAAAPDITAESVGADTQSWSIITEKYFNRKKKKILRVYRYTTSQIIQP